MGIPPDSGSRAGNAWGSTSTRRHTPSGSRPRSFPSVFQIGGGSNTFKRRVAIQANMNEVDGLVHRSWHLATTSRMRWNCSFALHSAAAFSHSLGWEKPTSRECTPSACTNKTMSTQPVILPSRSVREHSSCAKNAAAHRSMTVIRMHGVGRLLNLRLKGV